MDKIYVADRENYHDLIKNSRQIMEEDKVDDIRKQGSSGLMVPGEERFHKVYQMIDEADAATIKSYDSISV